MPVRDVGEGCEGVAADLVEFLGGGDEEAVGDDAGHEDGEGGEESSGASGPEAAEADAAVALRLGEQMTSLLPRCGLPKKKSTPR